MKNIFKNKKYTLIISILSVILILGITGTYAWYVWTTNGEQRNRIVTSVGAATVIYNDGASLIGQNLKPVEDKLQGIEKEITVRTNNATIFNVTFNLYLDIKELGVGLKHESFKFELWKDGTKIKEGNFSESYLTQNLINCNVNNTNHIVLLRDATIDKTLSTYKLYLWIDGVNYTNPDTMMNQKFSFRLHADGQNAVMSETIYPNGTFMHTIASKYNNSTNKDTVTNGGVTYSYDKDNNLLLDNDGNIRYFGSTPNNYVYFNCDDYKNPSASTCEKWRIIGVVDGKVKIVRGTSLGWFSFDYHEDGSGGNTWSDATVNTLLNDGYYNNKDGITYYGVLRGEQQATTVNFGSDGTGLTTATKINNLISKSNWYVNGFSSGSYAHQLYNSERTATSDWTGNQKWTGNIALMYPSDYAYAADFRACDNTIYAYNDSDCTSNNWIYKMNGSGNSALLLTYNPTSEKKIWRIAYTGEVNINGESSLSWNAFPTLYLDEDVVNFGGDGSSTNPYMIYPGEKKYDVVRGNLKEYITNLYVSNNPEQITQYAEDETTEVAKYYYSYMDEERTWGLMNDGLGATVNDTTALVNGTQGNIRYYGASPNNYIYFNCDNYSSQGEDTCERWRIIGIVDGKVKIIRDESLGGYAWDYNSDGSYDNNWHDSTLQVLLNNGYYNNLDGVSYYEYSDDGESKIINFKTDKKGIKNDKTREMISESTWYLGGYSNYDYIYTNDIYIYERGDTIGANTNKTWIGNIALMYPSDYGYALDLSLCNLPLNYSSEVTINNCKVTNWLFENALWLLTPVSENYVNDFSWSVQEYVAVAGPSVDNELWARPTLYLDSKLVLDEIGDGSYETPYQIKLS